MAIEDTLSGELTAVLNKIDADKCCKPAQKRVLYKHALREIAERLGYDIDLPEEEKANVSVCPSVN